MSFPAAHLEAAAYLFEQSHGNRPSYYELTLIKKAGLSEAPPAEVADAIWRALAGEPENPYRTTAYWALGKLARSEDKEKFVAALRREAPRDIRVGFQIMIALGNLGEPIFSRSGVGYNEDELNRQDAIAYLKARG